MGSTIESAANKVLSVKGRDILTNLLIGIITIAILFISINLSTRHRLDNGETGQEAFNNNNDNNNDNNINSGYQCLVNGYTGNNFDRDYVKLYDNIIRDQDRDYKSIDSIIATIGNANLQLDNRPESVAVNLGCRTGNINNYLSNRYNMRSIGLDRSSYMIDQCRENSVVNRETIDYRILDQGLDTLESINIDIDRKINLILCLNMEIYYYRDLDLFFSKCYNLLTRGGFLALHLIDYKKFNNTNVYSRINHFNPNSLSIKRVDDSVVKFNDLVYNSRYRIFSNDNNLQDTVWLTETITNTDTNTNNNQTNNPIIKEYIHDLNAVTNEEVTEFATKHKFTLADKINIQIDLGLQNYNDEYLYIFQK